MHKIFTLLLFSALVNNSHAQTTFQKTYGGAGNEGRCFVINTYDGGYALVGYSQSFSAGDKDIYLVRTDDNGVVLWTKTYGGTNNNDEALDIKQTADSGFVIAGTTASFGAGQYDVYLIRTDKIGDTLWTKTYGNSLDETAWCVQQTSDGGFIVAADWGSSGYNYLIKTNSAGDTLWTKIYDIGKPFSVIQNPDNGYTFCGSGYIFNSPDLFLYQTDSLGNVRWYKTYGGGLSDYGWQVIKANDGGYIVNGFTQSFGAIGTEQAYVVKTDSIGGLVWSKTYDVALTTEGTSIVSTGNGYALLCRRSNNGVSFQETLIKIDNQGNVTGARNYDSGFIGNLQRAGDGGFIISGNTSDCFLIKTDSSGNSGCNDSSVTVTVFTPPTQDSSYVPVLSFGTVVGTANNTVVASPVTTTAVICFSTGIEESEGDLMPLKVFPNPASGRISIALEKNSGHITSVTFYNMFGQQVLNSETTTDINVTPLSSGIYFIKIVNTQGIFTSRFQKIEP